MNYFFLILALLIQFLTFPTHIGYEFPHTIGRFGDQLITWIKARYASDKKAFSFVYTPFLYSDQMKLHNKEVLSKKGFEIKKADDLSQITQCDPNIFYILDYNFKGPGWHPMITNAEYRHFDDMFLGIRKDKKLYQKMKEEIELVNPQGVIKPPRKKMSIAVHVRNGGDYEIDKTWPYHRYLRFLPTEYYAHQIKYIAHKFRSRPLYIYIFTDNSHPEELIKKMQEIVNSPRITWDYRKAGNRHDTNVIEDMWSMAQFDYLIRPWSQLSRLSEFLGNHKFVTYPVEHKDEPDKHVISFHLRQRNGKILKDEIIIEKNE